MKLCQRNTNQLGQDDADYALVLQAKALAQGLSDNFAHLPDGSHRFVLGFDVVDGVIENLCLEMPGDVDDDDPIFSLFGFELQRANPDEDEDEEQPGFLDRLFGVDQDEEEDDEPRRNPVLDED